MWHIHTIDHAHPEVFVCYSSDAGRAWTLIPQASPGNSEKESWSFPLLTKGDAAGPAPPAAPAGDSAAASVAEAFDAPFDWHDHHQQANLRAAAPKRAVSVSLHHQVREVTQSRGVMTGAGLLLFGGALVLFLASRRRP